MAAGYDIRQALFDLRQQTHHQGLDWDFFGDVAVSVAHDGAAPALAELMMAAWQAKDEYVAYEALYTPLTRILDWRELGSDPQWGREILYSGRPDEVRFTLPRTVTDEYGGDFTTRPMQYVFTGTSLPSEYRAGKKRRGWYRYWMTATGKEAVAGPQSPAGEEYVLHAHWPQHWGDHRLLPRLYQGGIEATPDTPPTGYRERSREDENILHGRPVTGWVEFYAGTDGDTVNLSIGFDFYAMWIAFDAHAQLVRNLAEAHMRHGV